MFDKKEYMKEYMKTYYLTHPEKHEKHKEVMRRNAKKYKHRKKKRESNEPRYLRYFKDVECREPMYVIEFPDPIIRGNDISMIVYVKNNTSELLREVRFISEDPDLKMELVNSEWNEIPPYSVVPIKVTFNPSKNRECDLNSYFEVTGNHFKINIHKELGDSE